MEVEDQSLSSDKLVKAGGAKQLEDGQEEDADKDITDKEKCEPTSIVEANQDTAYVRYRSGLNAAGHQLVDGMLEKIKPTVIKNLEIY